jgi:HSP20 family protein
MALIRFNDYVPGTFNHLVDDLLNDTLYKSGTKKYRPSADVLENDKEYGIQLSLPGVVKKDIELNIDNRVLTITAVRNRPEHKEDVKYHLSETVYGEFERTFKLPENVKEDKISAKFEHGILLVNIPKDQPKPLKRTINIG